jgi:hypothetical protein
MEVVQVKKEKKIYILKKKPLSLCCKSIVISHHSGNIVAAGQTSPYFNSMIKTVLGATLKYQGIADLQAQNASESSLVFSYISFLFFGLES